jgi:hypothetical protein
MNTTNMRQEKGRSLSARAAEFDDDGPLSDEDIDDAFSRMMRESVRLPNLAQGRRVPPQLDKVRHELEDLPLPLRKSDHASTILRNPPLSQHARASVQKYIPLP